MAGVVGDINPKTMESAKRQFVELYGSALVLNTYLKIALVLVSLVALGLLGLNFHTAAKYSQVKPLVIRIDDVGRAEAVQYDAAGYQPQAPELLQRRRMPLRDNPPRRRLRPLPRRETIRIWNR